MTKCIVCNPRFLFAVLTLGTFLIAGVSVRGAEGTYHFLKEIPVGGEGGWDYLSVDAAARRLYVTHASKVVVLDLDKEKVVGEITDTPGVHGFAIAPATGRGFASNGQESKVSIVDLKTLKTLAKVETGPNPDAILYNPGHNEVYAFNGRGKSASVFHAVTGEAMATVELGGNRNLLSTTSGSVGFTATSKTRTRLPPLIPRLTRW